ncbi:hypothetical protein CBR_g28508 [Chara braunii]|uniref:C-type lectin domain-containing protein n=1 Tax=Chara braunii TaxID=69332 RepID=A0A388JWD3_CHABU|nr:hypothetical protein CBR_g28508 [Chara braunii]|eukprot:GBG62032.1 hypothetical protein CBR_g28508 [Chara braunii]
MGHWQLTTWRPLTTCVSSILSAFALAGEFFILANGESATTGGSCPSGWTRGPLSGICLRVVDWPVCRACPIKDPGPSPLKAWYQAELFCEQHGGHLASPKSHKEFADIYSLGINASVPFDNNPMSTFSVVAFPYIGAYKDPDARRSLWADCSVAWDDAVVTWQPATSEDPKGDASPSSLSSTSSVVAASLFGSRSPSNCSRLSFRSPTCPGCGPDFSTPLATWVPCDQQRAFVCSRAHDKNLTRCTGQLRTADSNEGWSECPAGWTLSSSTSPRYCVRLEERRLTWPEADEDCKKKNATLASPSNDVEARGIYSAYLYLVKGKVPDSPSNLPFIGVRSTISGTAWGAPDSGNAVSYVWSDCRVSWNIAEDKSGLFQDTGDGNCVRIAHPPEGGEGVITARYATTNCKGRRPYLCTLSNCLDASGKVCSCNSTFTYAQELSLSGSPSMRGGMAVLRLGPDTGAGKVEVVIKAEGEPSATTPPPPPLTPAQRRKREIQEKLREQQALLAEAERQKAAKLEAATDASRKEHLLQQAQKTFADSRVSQCTRDLAELVLLQDKLTAGHFTNWDERIQRLETRVADLGTQQSKILDAIQNLTAQLIAANLISPLVPVVPTLKPKKASQPPSPPSSPSGSSHPSHKTSPSVSSQAKATPPPTFAAVVAGDSRGPKIPAPDKFKGDDPKIDVGDWAAGTRAYVKGFQCPEQQKVATVMGLLEGPAQKWATSTASAQNQTLEDKALALGADKLLQALEDRFADKERAPFARLRLRSSQSLCIAPGTKTGAHLDVQAKLHVQAPSSDRRKGAFPRGGRKGKAAFAYAGSGTSSDAGSRPGTPPGGTAAAAVPDVAAVVQQLQAALGAFQKAGSTSSTRSSSKGKSQGRRSSTPARRPNLPRDVHFPADPLNPNTVPWHDLKIQEGVWRKRKERGVRLRCEGQHFLKDCPYMPSPAQSKN